ncbi:hypothetical protein CQA62_00615 [Helicobacter cholecystus]|uniref:Uncharacterized protein n=1 Tax=Helicobacter cholecystus TaxID=45498 RepID=A0A3D8IXG2_9HELI|nr:extracellular solute-binding protein [Helicobacter cholecystus]RDU69948.1 hypothetical protein CQA62_00615 [Helicobacter cholecystus]VEJ24886.1 Accessory colonization factor AcfC, contains ABC-type periplasmic domain [Helicobacter cholecystus]
MKKSLLFTTLMNVFLSAQIYVYGPGGPAPVLKELASIYEQKTGQEVIIIAGPASTWIDEAKIQADIIYSGNSAMMDTFISKMDGKISAEKIEVLNIRKAGIIVRPNNPKKIKNFKDLLKKDINIMVVNGAGQVGLYEDMALKYGKRENLVALRKNIKVFAPNSKIAVENWNNDSSIDALIIWEHWANAIGKDKAEFINSGKGSVMYRASEIVITNDSQNIQEAQDFINFIKSAEAQKVWVKEGWISTQ